MGLCTWLVTPPVPARRVVALRVDKIGDRAAWDSGDIRSTHSASGVSGTERQQLVGHDPSSRAAAWEHRTCDIIRVRLSWSDHVVCGMSPLK